MDPHPIISTESEARNSLLAKYSNRFTNSPFFTRRNVSYQISKNQPFNSWFKYKEGFSEDLVKHLIGISGISSGTIVDPFLGSGTTMFSAIKSGFSFIGYEILAPAILFAKARSFAHNVDYDRIALVLSNAKTKYKSTKVSKESPALDITRFAYPPENERLISKYRSFCQSIEDVNDRMFLEFIGMTCLEDASYTRKDGQFLRWDNRSGRILKGNFSKGAISSFDTLLNKKIDLILNDIKNRDGRFESAYNVIEGSCLMNISQLKSSSIDLFITSPPYCNRYDYTRTYALELAYLGYDNNSLSKLRQSLLSATVENKSKAAELKSMYNDKTFANIEQGFYSCNALHEVLAVLEGFVKDKSLNNPNIPRMIYYYFYEMTFIIYEISRTIKSGGKAYIVNDNVRYAGQEVPVDIILSSIAEHFGLSVDNIFVLDRGKGNSSQQMGTFGRTEIRKCIYEWSKQ